jgi:hypothetical protein
MTDTSPRVSDQPWPAADPRDVASIEAIIKAFDETLSFEPGSFGKEMDRLRSLFLPTANVVATAPWNIATDVEGFVAFYLEAIPQIEADKTGFGERNQIMRTVSIGDVHSVYTFYTLHMPPSNDEPIARGVNMLHVVKFKGRYWIASCVWEDESETAQIPADLIPASKAAHHGHG